MTPLLLPLGFGLPSGFEWVVILIVAFLIFGAKLPGIMRGLGGSVKEFKKGMSDDPAPTAQAQPQAQPPAHIVSRDSAPAVPSNQPTQPPTKS